jgi:hypothetical protein
MVRRSALERFIAALPNAMFGDAVQEAAGAQATRSKNPRLGPGGPPAKTFNHRAGHGCFASLRHRRSIAAEIGKSSSRRWICCRRYAFQ